MPFLIRNSYPCEVNIENTVTRSMVLKSIEA